MRTESWMIVLCAGTSVAEAQRAPPVPPVAATAPGDPRAVPPRQGTAVDVAVGVGFGFLHDDPHDVELLPGVGFDLGVGKYLSPNLSLLLRVNGLLVDGIVPIGAIGPAIQYWAGPAFFGGGVGAGFCLCGLLGGGWHVRTGLTFGRGSPSNLSFELSGVVGVESFTTGSLLLGFQSR